MVKTKIIIVSNHNAALEGLEKVIKETYPEWKVVRFTDSFYFVQYVEKNTADLALVAAWLRPLTGIDILKIMKRINQDLPTVVFADTEEYRAEAKYAGAYDYITLPITAEILKRLENERDGADL